MEREAQALHSTDDDVAGRWRIQRQLDLRALVVGGRDSSRRPVDRSQRNEVGLVGSLDLNVIVLRAIRHVGGEDDNGRDRYNRSGSGPY